MEHALAAHVRRLRSDPGVAVLEGFHAVKHAIRFDAEMLLVAAADRPGLDALAAELAPDVRGALMRLARPADPAVISLAVARAPRTGVIGFARRPATPAEPLLAASRSDPVVLLEDPRHLGNVGAVVRVAAAAQAAAVLTTGDRDPWDPAALRGSAGLHFAVPVGRVGSLDTSGRPLVAVDPDGEVPLGSAAIPPGAVLAFGTERHGLSETVCRRATMRVRIPMRPGVSSLNLATAVAVVLYGLTAGTEKISPKSS